MNAQQEAVALWKFLEGRGVRPSIRKVVAMMRLADIPVNEADAGKWLAAFAAASPHPKTHRSKIPAQGQHGSSTSNSTPAAQIQHSEQHDNSTRPALTRAPNVSLVSKPVEPSDTTYPQSPPLFLVEPVAKPAPPSKPVTPKPAKPKAVRAPYVPPPCPDDLPDLIPSSEPAALREMAAVFVASFANATGDHAAKHIGPYAAMLAKAAGRRRTTEEAWDACGIAREIDGGKPLFMGTCNRALDHLPFRKWDEPMPGEGDDNFVRGCDLVAMGLAPAITAADIPPWERPPFHPDYAPRPAAMA